MVTARRYVDLAPVTTVPGSLTSGATSFTVVSAAGFPTSFPYYATLDLGLSSAEVISVTDVTGTTVTCVRNANGLGAYAHTSATLTHTAVALDYQEANAHHVASGGVHGLAGAVVGTSDTQTLSGKSFSDSVSVAGGVTAVGDVKGATVNHLRSVETGTVTFSSASGLATRTVNFGLPPTGSAVVQLTAEYLMPSDGGGQVLLSHSITSTDFTIYLYRQNARTIKVHYTAAWSNLNQVL